jgi:hypothetical protein
MEEVCEVVNTEYEVVSRLDTLTWLEWCIVVCYTVHRIYVIFN